MQNLNTSPINNLRKIALTIELDSGKKDTFFLSPGDSSEAISKEISKKHGLNPDLEKLLTKMIQDSISAPINPSETLHPESKPKNTIHNRLYMDSKFTKRLKKAQVPSILPEKQSCHTNYGDILYQQSKLAEHQKWKKNTDFKLSIQEKLNKELTFHPHIPSRETSDFSSNSDVFYRTRATVKRPERSSSNRQLEECSFKPKISSQLQGSGNVHQKLYMQALVKQKSMQKIESRKNSQNYVPDDQERVVCITRLLNSHLVAEAKIKKNKEKMHAPVDLETNQALFHPKIGREPQVINEKPVWSRLSNTKDQEKQIDPEDIYKKFRKVQYQQIFEMMDKDGDGEIEISDDSLVEFDDKIKVLFLKVMGKIEGRIDFEAFTETFEANINYLTIEERMMLLRRNNQCR